MPNAVLQLPVRAGWALQHAQGQNAPPILALEGVQHVAQVTVVPGMRGVKLSMSTFV